MPPTPIYIYIYIHRFLAPGASDNGPVAFGHQAPDPPSGLLKTEVFHMLIPGRPDQVPQSPPHLYIPRILAPRPSDNGPVGFVHHPSRLLKSEHFYLLIQGRAQQAPNVASTSPPVFLERGSAPRTSKERGKCSPASSRPFICFRILFKSLQT